MRPICGSTTRPDRLGNNPTRDAPGGNETPGGFLFDGRGKREGGRCMPTDPPLFSRPKNIRQKCRISGLQGPHKRKSSIGKGLRSGQRGRDTPPEAPHRVAHIRSYPPLDFFTPLAPMCLRPSFLPSPARVAVPPHMCRRLSIAFLCVARGLCVAMVGMDEIWWLDVDSGDESPDEWYE
jgi:hypothetical protein